MQTLIPTAIAARCLGLVALGLAALASTTPVHGQGNTSTFCSAYEDNNRRQKVDLRIEFDDATGKPNRIIVAGLDGERLKLCRKDKVRWIAKRPFEIRFESADLNPVNDDWKRKSIAHRRMGWQHLPAKPIKEGAAAGEYKYTICTPDCVTADDKIWDPIVIVED